METCNIMNKNERMLNINNKINNCKNCDLYLSRNNAVPGEGNLNAKVMVIGEGPGRDNDLQGRPFVGKGGKILDDILCEVEIAREELFLTNILKCRMPENKTPTKDYINICCNYLFQQVEVISPLYIITLGAVAIQSLLDKSVKLSDIEGKCLDWKGYMVIPTYHPSASRYNKDVINKIKKTMIYVKENIK